MMIRTVVDIDGMMCGMCESHVNDAVRNNFKVKKVSSSHGKGRTVIAVSYTHLDVYKRQAQTPHLRSFTTCESR